MSVDLNNSKPFSNGRGHKFWPIDSRGDRGDRRGAVAAIQAKPGGVVAGVQGLAMLFYTPTTYPGQGTAQEGCPGLVGTLTYAPRACPVAAVG